MHSLIVIFALVGVTMGAPQQQGYNIQAPASNSLQPGGGVSISAAQPSFGSSNNNIGGVSLGSVVGNAGQNGFNSGNTGQTGLSNGNAGQTGFSSGNTVQTVFSSGNAGQSGFNSGNAGQTGFNGGNVGQTGLNGGNAGQTGYNGGNTGPTGFNGGNTIGSGNAGQPVALPATCAQGEVLHVDGKCVKPIISRNIFVYAAPEVTQQLGPAPELPKPKVEYNIVFVRTPEAAEGAEPIIVPPPQQKTLVYVLSKKGSNLGPQVIEVPAGPDHQPEVYYVNYADGENPTLPGGVDLQQALSAAATTGQVIGGGAGTGIGGNSAGLGGGAGLGAGGGAGIGGQSSNGGSFTGPSTSGSFGGSSQGGNFGGSGQGQGGNYAAPSSGGNIAGGSPSGGSFVGGSSIGGSFVGTPSTGSGFASSSSSNSFSSSSNSNSNSFSSNFIGGNQGNGGGFIPSVQQAQGQAPAPQAPSGIYNRPN